MKSRLVAAMLCGGLAVAATGWGTVQTAGAATPSVTCASLASARFTHPTRITNADSPLVPGTTFTYQGKTKGHTLDNVVSVTHQTRVVDGTTTVVVDDQVFEAGSLTEHTFDWFAQDNDGNIWYFGEDSTEFKDGVVIGDGGSWEAGVSGAEPGIFMEANPRVGDVYCQENVPGIAEDRAQVVALGQSLCVPYGCFFGNVLQTREFTPLEPGHAEYKYYAPGVGLLEAVAVTGGTEIIKLVGVQTGG